MHDDLERTIRAASLSGWRTVAVSAALLLLQWVAYLIVMSSRPGLILTLWGTSSWEEVQHLWLLAIGVLKVFMFVLAILCLWLTLWARELRKGRTA